MVDQLVMGVMVKCHMGRGEETCVRVWVRKSEKYHLEDSGVMGYY